MTTKIGFVQAGRVRGGGLRGLDEAIPAGVQVEHVGMDVVMDFTIKSSYDANRPLMNQKEQPGCALVGALESGTTLHDRRPWAFALGMAWPAS